MNPPTSTALKDQYEYLLPSIVSACLRISQTMLSLKHRSSLRKFWKIHWRNFDFQDRDRASAIPCTTPSGIERQCRVGLIPESLLSLSDWPMVTREIRMSLFYEQILEAVSADGDTRDDNLDEQANELRTGHQYVLVVVRLLVLSMLLSK